MIITLCGGGSTFTPGIVKSIGHVADVDDTSVGTQHAAALGDDGGRVGVVENPVVLLGVLLNVIDQLDHGEDGAHAVGKAATTAIISRSSLA